MIINIAGTSGSGKSHLVRGFINWAEKRGVVKPCYKDDRKDPIGYDIILPKERTIHVVGHYGEADSGGCDTIRNVNWIYDYIEEQYNAGKVVLYEGLFMMNMIRGPILAAETNCVYVLQFTDPLAVCIASIDKRRASRGDKRLLKKENTIGNFRRANSYCDKMRAAGAEVIRVRRTEAFDTLVRTISSAD